MSLPIYIEEDMLFLYEVIFRRFSDAIDFILLLIYNSGINSKRIQIVASRILGEDISERNQNILF